MNPELRLALEEALQALRTTGGEDLARQIKPILLANLDRGRVQYFVDDGKGSVADYVALVADRFTRLSGYLRQLQTERSPEAWEPLFERMQAWAYNFLLRKGFTADQSALDAADECSTDAAVNLLTAHFPYDADFDAWAHILVHNTCRKFMAAGFKKSVVPDARQVDLEEELVEPDEILLEIRTLQQETRHEILAALGQLSEARRSVIWYAYFEEMKPEEIAQKLGKSIGAVYSLQFHGLQDLRKILTGIRDRLNE